MSYLFKIFTGICVFLAMINVQFFLLPQTAQAETDYEKYLKYKLYEKYEKYDKYQDYEEYKKAKKKYKLNSSERKKYNQHYKLYKKTKQSQYYAGYKKYKNYKNKYKPLKKYSKYKKYKKYDKKEYKDYKKYGSSSYKEGYERYLASKETSPAAVYGEGEADLGGGTLGPEITVGLDEFTKNHLEDHAFKVTANNDYVIKDKDGTLLATISSGTETRVKYGDNHQLRVYESIEEILVDDEVRFEPSDPDSTNTVFDYNRAGTDFDQYRDKIKLRVYDSPEADGDRIWVINTLPLEHYVWGMGEITGTGHMEYNKVMTTSFRTYGYWKIKFSTQYAPQGFNVNATPGNQLYYGYDWETSHERIKEGAEATRGKIVMHEGDIAITPYSSWTDGRTRSFEERWGSTNYPWCQSVEDPYGKHPTKSTSELEDEGNHMVGLSAHGALTLATDHNWDWDEIIKYYYTNVYLYPAY